MSAELKNCPFCGGEAKLIEGEECAYVQCLQVKCHRGPFVDGDNAAADEAVEHWNRRTDLSQAAVAAALEAAAVLCDEASAYREKQLTTEVAEDATKDRWRGGKMQATLLANAIRTLITPAQHDALAAHVAAAVAKARAGGAELISASLALKEIVEGVSGAMDHGTFRAEKGMRLKDTPEWVAFYVALAKIGAKP